MPWLGARVHPSCSPPPGCNQGTQWHPNRRSPPPSPASPILPGGSTADGGGAPAPLCRLRWRKGHFCCMCCGPGLPCDRHDDQTVDDALRATGPVWHRVARGDTHRQTRLGLRALPHRQLRGRITRHHGPHEEKGKLGAPHWKDPLSVVGAHQGSSRPFMIREPPARCRTMSLARAPSGSCSCR